MPPNQRLPSELIALVHHVELSNAGWWELAVERLVVIALWGSSAPLGSAQIVRRLSEEFEIAVQASEVELALGGLSASQVIEAHGGDAYTLAAATRDALSERIGASEALMEAFRSRFEQTLDLFGVGLPGDADAGWSIFLEELIAPLVASLGARVYELSGSDGMGVIDESKAVEAFLSHFEDPDVARKALVALLDPGEEVVRASLLQWLSASYVAQASRLPRHALTSLIPVEGERPSLRVFLDTNYVFSLLGLHGNPSNEAAVDLRRVLEDVRDSVDVSLYVLPITVEELQRVLRSVSMHFGETRPSVQLAAAATGLHSAGLIARYLEVASVADPPPSIAEFFEPYEQNPLVILRQNGVELFNEAMASYRTEGSVLDDLHAQEEFQRVHRDFVKPYESNLHDMVLWHCVSRKRPPGETDALKARDWIATVDFAGLLSFDRHKQRQSGSALPVCIHPSTLVQLLQFWIPRDEALDRAVAASFRLPILMGEFDDRAQEVTIRILRRLARFEGVADLSQETIREILVGEALRGRISVATTEEEEDDLVKLELIERLRALESDAAQLRKAHEAEVQRSTDLGNRLGDSESALSAVERQRLDLEAEVEDQRVRADAAELAARELSGRLNKLERERAVRTSVTKLVSQSALILGLLIGAARAVWDPAEQLIEDPTWRLLGIGAVCLLAWTGSAVGLSTRYPALEDLRLVKALARVKRTLLVWCGAVVVAVVAAGFAQQLWP